MGFNYQTICHGNLLKDLPERQADVLVRRFGLGRQRETLESIGQDYDVTRERIRQIEEDGIKGLAEKLQTPLCRNVFNYFLDELKSSGFLRKEDILLTKLGNGKFNNYVLFLLTLARPFQRFNETEDFYSFWATDKNAFQRAQKAVDLFIAELKKKNKTLPLPENIHSPYIEISKKILKGPDGFYGLPEWPEVNPRGVKDKAYLVFKQKNNPLHFTEVSRLIGEGALVQTVHNELIRDPRFVLVGRGLYALQEWGYLPGVVREVISKILKESKTSLTKDEVVKKVLAQRQVKPSTVLLNLQNTQYFIKNSQGKYTIRTA